MKQPVSSSPEGVRRRTWFAGAGALGAVAALATVSPPRVTPTALKPTTPQAPPEQGGGYALTEHVKRYYQTTRV